MRYFIVGGTAVRWPGVGNSAATSAAASVSGEFRKFKLRKIVKLNDGAAASTLTLYKNDGTTSHFAVTAKVSSVFQPPVIEFDVELDGGLSAASSVADVNWMIVYDALE